MSRIGLKPITIPAGVQVTIADHKVTVKGAHGTLEKEFRPEIAIQVEGNQVHISRLNELKQTKQLHGTTRALLANMVNGVATPFVKELEIKGIGFKAALRGNDLVLNVGYSHEVVVPTLPGVKIETKSPTLISVSGCDRQAVGQIAAEIRRVRPPEPYLGKGIAYKGEHIRRKEGKKAGK